MPGTSGVFVCGWVGVGALLMLYNTLELLYKETSINMTFSTVPNHLCICTLHNP